MGFITNSQETLIGFFLSSILRNYAVVANELLSSSACSIEK